jgi:hypothetical protein
VLIQWESYSVDSNSVTFKGELVWLKNMDNIPKAKKKINVLVAKVFISALISSAAKMA